MDGASDSAEASTREVLEELERFLREARSARALAAVGPDCSLERDLGLGSLERVELLSRLETRFRRRAPERTLGEAETPRDLARAFRSATEALTVSPPASRPEGRRGSKGNPALEAKTLTQALALHAAEAPDLPHVYLESDDRAEETVSYADLYREALSIGGALQARGIGRGDTVAIMLPTCRGFFSAFMGTLFARGVPVPLYPPFSRSRIGEYARRQSALLENARARLLITVREGRGLGSALRSSVPSLEGLAEIEELPDEGPALDGPADSEPDDLALIQYTSGSTGEPKGVPLTHGNLLANVRAIGEATHMGPSDVGVSWLPLYHDMGLIGAWLTPLFFGFPVAILSPLTFLSRPERWLFAIHRRQATISPAPNFAYELCARRIADRDLEGLDLGSWRAALNGAEPISPRTLERFEQKFSKCGFRSTSFFPVYGLAESALLLSAPVLGAPLRIEASDRRSFEREGTVIASRPSSEPLRFVSVGRPIPGHQIRIVDEQGEALPERCEGRLVFRGPSSMSGYYRNAKATEAVKLANGFLDSGDRAFFADGELFITGRAKDLIIKAGRNLLPQEIEAAASEVPGVRAGSVVAFGIPDAALGTERLVVVVETKEETPAERARIESEVGGAVADLVGVPPDEVAAVRPRMVPKTSSGKIRRSACREMFLNGELHRKPRRLPWAETSLYLRSRLSRAGDGIEQSARAVYGLYVYLLAAAFLLFGWTLAVAGVSGGALRRIVRRASRLYLRLTGIPFEIRGSDRLRSVAGPLVIVSNHSSYGDPLPLMAAIDRDYAFAIKREAFSWPVLGRILASLEHVPVDRDDAEEGAQSAEALRVALAAGRSLVLFPEGTFTRATGLRPFKMGAFQLASEAGVPVLPLALVGMRRLLRDGTWVPRRIRVAVELAEPLHPGRSFGDVIRVKEEAAAVLAQLSGEPRLGS
jgi:1-acyl-sn-glycerol-3-phosphate acyltransferase